MCESKLKIPEYYKNTPYHIRFYDDIMQEEAIINKDDLIYKIEHGIHLNIVGILLHNFAIVACSHDRLIAILQENGYAKSFMEASISMHYWDNPYAYYFSIGCGNPKKLFDIFLTGKSIDNAIMFDNLLNKLFTNCVDIEANRLYARHDKIMRECIMDYIITLINYIPKVISDMKGNMN